MEGGLQKTAFGGLNYLATGVMQPRKLPDPPNYIYIFIVPPFTCSLKAFHSSRWRHQVSTAFSGSQRQSIFYFYVSAYPELRPNGLRD